MIILRNGTIYTSDPRQPIIDGIVIEDHNAPAGRILAVGEGDKLLQAYGGKAVVEDLDGKVVLPGLTDAHIHLRQYAQALRKVDCSTARREECLARVSERAKSTPKEQWILGHGWNQNLWEGSFGTAAELDAAAPHHPVYLTATSLHAGWANSAALKAAGIDAATPDPPDGKIAKDQDGMPSGILFEKAMKLVSDAIPKASLEENARMMLEAQTELWKMGLTGGHDFDRRESFAALQLLNEQGRLKFRVVKSIPVEQLEEALALGLRTGFGDDMLRIGSIKIFADGALGPRTAAMLEPYAGEPENRGMLFSDREEIFEIGRDAAAGGFSLAIHAIGDRANHEVLSAYRDLRQFEREQRLPSLRHRLEHAQILHPGDFDMFKANEVIASMQPIHAASDMEMADRYWEARSENAYAWRSVEQAGGRLCFGSDAPVDSPNPFWGVHAAVTRRRADGSPGEKGWYPEQRLSVQEALAGYTQGAAYAGGMENKSGRIAPGYLADLIVLERDPFNVPPDELRELRPAGTMVGGDWVWRS